jgi:hypothetical protein
MRAPRRPAASVALPYGSGIQAGAATDNRPIGFQIGAMVFNRKAKFFLNLDENAADTPVSVAPLAAPAEPEASESSKPAAPAAPQATENPAATSTSDTPTSPVLTTAEAIAAELAAAQAARPAISNSTFAPDFVTAGGALPVRRRKAGANLAGFKDMAGSLFGKK